MAWEDIADYAGAAAAVQFTPFLTLHGAVSLWLFVREFSYFMNLRNLKYVRPRAWLQALPCLMIAYHYFIETINFLFYLETRFFSSKGFIVHHVFCLNMILVGVQTKLFNAFTLAMQIAHGAFVLSLQVSPEVTVVMSNWYFYTGVATFLYHSFAALAFKQPARDRAGTAALAASILFMGWLGNQDELFQYCHNRTTVSSFVLIAQIAAGSAIAAVSVLPAFYFTLKA